MYYLRTMPAANPIQFTVDKTKINNAKATAETNGHLESEEEINMRSLVCSLENNDECLSCGS